jgi:hypothetical protein
LVVWIENAVDVLLELRQVGQYLVVQTVPNLSSHRLAPFSQSAHCPAPEFEQFPLILTDLFRGRCIEVDDLPL